MLPRALLLACVAVPVGRQSRDVEMRPQRVALVTQGSIRFERSLEIPEAGLRIAEIGADGSKLVKEGRFDPLVSAAV